MYINFATIEPRPGKEQELADLMRAFRDALKVMPGNVGVYVLRDETTGGLAGLSIWQNKDAFEAAMARASSLPSHSPESLRVAPPVVRQFVEI